jgi:cell division protein FtsZ
MTQETSSLILIGVGGSGVNAVRGVRRAYGQGIRTVGIDSDASSGTAGDIPFVLLGGDRLAGRGSGGLSAEARAAFLDNPSLIDQHLEGVRTAIIVTALGGGTGGGGTGEIVKYLSSRGITTAVFASMPFAFEGESRIRAARTAAVALENDADALVTLPLDTLAAEASQDNMKEALSRAADVLATSLTLFWRILEKPGYISLDAERLRNAISGGGRARFATASGFGPDRAEQVLAALSTSKLMNDGHPHPPAKTIFMGILAGDDLRLSEIACIADGFRNTFGRSAAFNLGTVNDEETFSGRLAAVALLFDENPTASASFATRRKERSAAKNRRNSEAALASGDRFADSEKTMWRDQDLDIPTYLRRNLTLEK